MLRVEHLSFGGYRTGQAVLSDLSFSLEAGELLGVLGNNGAGKSTLLKCLCRILSPSGGRVMLDGKDLLPLSHRERARQVAYVAQSTPETELTVYDTVLLGRRPHMGLGCTSRDHQMVYQALERLGLEAFQGRRLSQLSGGERQKVMLARALAQQPRLLLLDEPTSNLDIRSQYQVLELVRDICGQEGLGAILVIHDLNLALRFCHQILLLKDGALCRRGPPSVLDRQTLWEVYGIAGRLASVEGHPHPMILID